MTIGPLTSVLSIQQLEMPLSLSFICHILSNPKGDPKYWPLPFVLFRIISITIPLWNKLCFSNKKHIVSFFNSGV